MAKRITKRQEEAIRSFVKKGFSANQIQVKLRDCRMGLRRKALLAEVRRVRGQKPKARTVKYIPKKYAKARWMAKTETLPKKRLRPFFAQMQGKQVSVYGHCSNGIGERYDFHGTGRELYRAIMLAHRIVPKRRFVRVSASEFLAHPFRYGERGYWVDRAVES